MTEERDPEHIAGAAPTSAWTRWALLVTPLTLAAALVLTSWASYRVARRASAGMARAHGDLILRDLERTLTDTLGPPDSDGLREMLADGADLGLLYLAVLGRDAEPVFETGTRGFDKPVEPARAEPSGRLESRGSIYRLIARLPPPRERSRPPGPADRGRENRPPPPGRGKQGPPRRGAPSPIVVLEYRAAAVEQLLRSTGRNLLAALAGALMLAGATVVFWRREVERQRQAESRERQKRLSSLGEMAAVMAHEIRNPLASLKGNAQLLAEGFADEAPEAGKTRRIVAEATRLEELLSSLLDFSRSGPLSRAPVDPVELLRAAAADAGGARVEIDSARAPGTWALDALRMRQVLTNLLRNAAQASPPGEPIEASVAAAGGELVVTIADRGGGIPAGDEQRIFEPFFTTRSSGTGLGLAVARRIVEMHGGALTARNRPGGGAAFAARLPAASESGLEDTRWRES